MAKFLLETLLAAWISRSSSVALGPTPRSIRLSLHHHCLALWVLEDGLGWLKHALAVVSCSVLCRFTVYYTLSDCWLCITDTLVTCEDSRTRKKGHLGSIPVSGTNLLCTIKSQWTSLGFSSLAEKMRGCLGKWWLLGFIHVPAVVWNTGPSPRDKECHRGLGLPWARKSRLWHLGLAFADPSLLSF